MKAPFTETDWVPPRTYAELLEAAALLTRESFDEAESIISECASLSRVQQHAAIKAVSKATRIPMGTLSQQLKEIAGPKRGSNRANGLAVAAEVSARTSSAQASEDPDERRRRQREENAKIGAEVASIPTSRTYSFKEMLANFVFIHDGSQVAPIDSPRSLLLLSDFRNAVAASLHPVEGENGKVSMVPVSKLWMQSPDRLAAETVTFRAGYPRMTIAPETGRSAFNLWVAPARAAAPSDWETRAAPFVEHVRWLWGENAEAFLNWLAHIEQEPGVLPHFGWVHISRVHGKGRNWISSVLARMWAGHVAASLDLVGMLNNGFNGQLSQKLLAIVDEINEGGNSSYKHAQKLRQWVTEEWRHINPKFGRERHEWNSCRWLLFSNHTGAIPLGADDRRFWVVSHEGQPKAPEYYGALYGRLKDQAFIPSVAEFLKRRDISSFKPGDRPPMTAAKAELVAFSQTEDDITLKEIAENWPVDIITNFELTSLLDAAPTDASARHAIDRAGLRRLGDKKVSVAGQGKVRVHAVRNFEKWSVASHAQKKAEIEREGEYAKRLSIGRDVFG